MSAWLINGNDDDDKLKEKKNKQHTLNYRYYLSVFVIDLNMQHNNISWIIWRIRRQTYHAKSWNILLVLFGENPILLQYTGFTDDEKRRQTDIISWVFMTIAELCKRSSTISISQIFQSIGNTLLWCLWTWLNVCRLF